MASLRAALLDAPEQSPAGIHGVGGMGKTALAQSFAYKEADAFPGGCWLLRCEGRDRLLSVFRNLVTDLEIELTDEERLDDAKAVRRVFDVLRARGPAMFLLDNVDRPALLAQEQMILLADQSWARVLYTTRLAPDDFTKAGARIRPLDLERLPEIQGVDLIRRCQPGQAFASARSCLRRQPSQHALTAHGRVANRRTVDAAGAHGHRSWNPSSERIASHLPVSNRHSCVVSKRPKPEVPTDHEYGNEQPVTPSQRQRTVTGFWR